MNLFLLLMSSRNYATTDRKSFLLRGQNSTVSLSCKYSMGLEYMCCMIFYCFINEIIKHDLRNSINETHFFIKISLSYFILERGTQFVVSLIDRWRDIYTDRELLLAPYLLPGASGCQRLHPLASRIVRDDTNVSDRLRIPGSTLDSDWTDCLNLTAWSYAVSFR